MRENAETMRVLRTKSEMNLGREMTSALRTCLARLADLLCGCRHRKTTLPITLPAAVGVGAQPKTKADTYMVCLECGRHLAYDWTARFNTSAAAPLRKKTAAPEREQGHERAIPPDIPDHDIELEKPAAPRSENTP